MIIKLNENINPKEFCKVSVNGKNNKPKFIEIIFSKEALIGFATEALLLCESIEKDEKLNLVTYPLKIDPAPNQILGFYLVSDGANFVLKINYLKNYKIKNINLRKLKAINIHQNIDEYYSIRHYSDTEKKFDVIESYELARKNIIKINIYNDNQEKVVGNYNDVIFEINSFGLEYFAYMLLTWANNCKKGEEYYIPGIYNNYEGHNLGIILTEDSIPIKLKCDDLGSIYDYDSNF